MIESSADAAVDDAPLLYYDERHEDGAAFRVLDSVRLSNPNVDRYLNNALEDESEATEDGSDEGAGGSREVGYLNLRSIRFRPSAKVTGRRPARSYSVEEVIGWIRSAPADARESWLSSWGALASDEQVAALAESMESETEQGRVWRYLRVFLRRRVPIVPDWLLRLVEHEDIEFRRLVYRVLSNVSEGRVRQLALRHLTPERIAEGSIALFKSSYEPGDYEAIEAAISIPEDREQAHTVAKDLRGVLANHPLPEVLRLALYVYEWSPCTLCRAGIVRLLPEIDEVPNWIAEEGRFDAGEAIRERFGEEA